MSTFTFDNSGRSAASDGPSNNWNYSKKDAPDYTTTLQGTVVELKQVQETQYETNAPLFWGDHGKTTEDTGKPCLIFCIVVDSEQFGEKEWVVNLKAKKDPVKNPFGLSLAGRAIREALVNAKMNPENLDQLGGMNVAIQTKEPPEGFGYGAGSPRPFRVTILGNGNKPFRGCFPFGKSPQPTGPAPSALQQAMSNAAQAVSQNQMQQAGAFPAFADEDIPF